MPTKKKDRASKRKANVAPPQLGPGMPSLDNVKGVTDFVSPKGDKYKILKTTEQDAYDPPVASRKSKK